MQNAPPQSNHIKPSVLMSACLMSVESTPCQRRRRSVRNTAALVRVGPIANSASPMRVQLLASVQDRIDWISGRCVVDCTSRCRTDCKTHAMQTLHAQPSQIASTFADFCRFPDVHISTAPLQTTGMQIGRQTHPNVMLHLIRTLLQTNESFFCSALPVATEPKQPDPQCPWLDTCFPSGLAVQMESPHRFHLTQQCPHCRWLASSCYVHSQ